MLRTAMKAFTNMAPVWKVTLVGPLLIFIFIKELMLSLLFAGPHSAPRLSAVAGKTARTCRKTWK